MDFFGLFPQICTKNTKMLILLNVSMSITQGSQDFKPLSLLFYLAATFLVFPGL